MRRDIDEGSRVLRVYEDQQARQSPANHSWHFIPCSTIKPTTRPLFIYTTPLLEEKRDCLSNALITNISYPFRLHRTRARARLTTHNYPMNSSEWKSWNRA